MKSKYNLENSFYYIAYKERMKKQGRNKRIKDALKEFSLFMAITSLCVLGFTLLAIMMAGSLTDLLLII